MSAYYLLFSIAFNRGKLLWIDYNIITKFSGFEDQALEEHKNEFDLLYSIKNADSFGEGLEIIGIFLALIFIVIPLVMIIVAFLWPVSILAVGASVLVLKVQSEKDG